MAASVLTILHSNDVHSRFDAWARMETIARQIRAEVGRENLIRLDAGDHSDRSVPLTDATQGRVNMDLLTAAGVDAFAFGNNETLVWPVAHQAALAQSVPFSCLAADLRLKDGTEVPGLADRAVVGRAGLKIGLFGLSRDNDQFFANLGLSHRSPAETAQECVRELRVAGCNLVICVSHLGYQQDTTLAVAAPGIDVIVGGHSHSVLPRGELVGSTIVVQAGAYARHVGRLDLTIANGIVAAWEATLIETETAPPDEATLDLLAQWGQKSAERLAEVVGFLPVPLPHEPLGDSPLADLMARRLRAQFGAEVGLVHGGVLLAGLPAGPVTRGDLLRICPCMLNPTVAEFPGHKLLELLATPLEALRTNVKGNGMRGETVAGRIFWSGPDRIEPERTYRVACNDYLTFGFEPFGALKGAGENIHYEMDLLLRDTLREALTGRAGWPGEPMRVEAYGIDGRLRKFVHATLISSGPEEVVLRAGPPYRVEPGQPDGKPLDIPYAIDYHFWPGRPYNLFRFFDRDGDWVADYYNVAMPFASRPGALIYADLELDVHFEAGKPPQLLDEDDLEAADYPPELTARVRQVAESLLALGESDLRPGGPIWPRPAAKDSPVR
ncbi:MAG TPA: DUF402 domain-containing protein [Symbiobacteriaceae bacterium]|jgi:2',3'-cyclic-nucleotide 2'-phosphodiesterase (5'-nucleotidase family)/protein associated with RNAse G/E